MPQEPPLRDDAIVIRGGLMELVPLRVALDTCFEENYFYGLSVFGENDLTVEEIAEAAGGRLPHTSIRVSTVGQSHGHAR
jgi:hypothetical protein